MRKTILSLVVIAIGATAAPATASLPIPQLPSPSSFAQRIDNPWFPLLPGTVYEYRGVRDGKQARDVLTVTHQHATVQGIQTTVLHDRLWLNGRLFERTTDWYAQDKQGNVWYLGESTALLNAHGKVTSTEGSWKAGVGGAQPGSTCSLTPSPETPPARNTSRATPQTSSRSSPSTRTRRC